MVSKIIYKTVTLCQSMKFKRRVKKSYFMWVLANLVVSL